MHIKVYVITGIQTNVLLSMNELDKEEDDIAL